MKDTNEMRTLALIGGMSWESTALYYSGLNRGVAEKMGGLHSAPLLMASVDFQKIVDYQLSDQWDKAGCELADLAKRLEDAGADAIALAVNTMHKVADPIRDAVSIPFLDIREALGTALTSTGADKAVLLGTNYVAREDYYFGQVGARLAGEMKLSLLPDDEQSFVHDIIYGELAKGEVSPVTRQKIANGISRVVSEQGVGAVALACTELPMLDLGKLLPDLPIADSTNAHIAACVNFITNS